VSDQYSRTEGYGFNFHWGLTLTYGISHLKVAVKKRCQKVGIPLMHLTKLMSITKLNKQHEKKLKILQALSTVPYDAFY